MYYYLNGLPLELLTLELLGRRRLGRLRGGGWQGLQRREGGACPRGLWPGRRVGWNISALRLAQQSGSAVAVHSHRVHLGPGVRVCHEAGPGLTGGGKNRGTLVKPVRVLLHVLGQVGLLGVALAAVRADVGLDVLRVLVLGDVLQERGLLGEALVAGVALVGLVRLVAPRVGLQVRQLGERLRAA